MVILLCAICSIAVLTSSSVWDRRPRQPGPRPAPRFCAIEVETLVIAPGDLVFAEVTVDCINGEEDNLAAYMAPARADY